MAEESRKKIAEIEKRLSKVKVKAVSKPVREEGGLGVESWKKLDDCEPSEEVGGADELSGWFSSGELISGRKKLKRSDGTRAGEEHSRLWGQRNKGRSRKVLATKHHLKKDAQRNLSNVQRGGSDYRKSRRVVALRPDVYNSLTPETSEVVHIHREPKEIGVKKEKKRTKKPTKKDVKGRKISAKIQKNKKQRGSRESDKPIVVFLMEQVMSLLSDPVPHRSGRRGGSGVDHKKKTETKEKVQKSVRRRPAVKFKKGDYLLRPGIQGVAHAREVEAEETASIKKRIHPFIAMMLKKRLKESSNALGEVEDAEELEEQSSANGTVSMFDGMRLFNELLRRFQVSILQREELRICLMRLSLHELPLALVCFEIGSIHLDEFYRLLSSRTQSLSKHLKQAVELADEEWKIFYDIRYNLKTFAIEITDLVEAFKEMAAISYTLQVLQFTVPADQAAMLNNAELSSFSTKFPEYVSAANKAKYYLTDTEFKPELRTVRAMKDFRKKYSAVLPSFGSKVYDSLKKHFDSYAANVDRRGQDDALSHSDLHRLLLPYTYFAIWLYEADPKRQEQMRNAYANSIGTRQSAAIEKLLGQAAAALQAEGFDSSDEGYVSKAITSVIKKVVVTLHPIPDKTAINKLYIYKTHLRRSFGENYNEFEEVFKRCENFQAVIKNRSCLGERQQDVKAGRFLSKWYRTDYYYTLVTLMEVDVMREHVLEAGADQYLEKRTLNALFPIVQIEQVFKALHDLRLQHMEKKPVRRGIIQATIRPMNEVDFFYRYVMICEGITKGNVFTIMNYFRLLESIELIEDLRSSPLNSEEEICTTRLKNCIDAYMKVALGDPFPLMQKWFVAVEGYLHQGVSAYEIKSKPGCMRSDLVQALETVTKATTEEHFRSVFNKIEVDFNIKGTRSTLKDVLWRKCRLEFLYKLDAYWNLIQSTYNQTPDPQGETEPLFLALDEATVNLIFSNVQKDPIKKSTRTRIRETAPLEPVTYMGIGIGIGAGSALAKGLGSGRARGLGSGSASARLNQKTITSREAKRRLCN
ncbi:unnamed protein product [Cyprideis torosa]|uniref:Uncharacterized protein n=1 Tax=Cyprideis torosa TaxID=163714 RepID=A0A7R8ZM21_9CRUS|nr:unnamed protein product [Cyprideis torosa]CAG0883381.1 unnamed protein product [Cyprideis torosa]